MPAGKSFIIIYQISGKTWRKPPNVSDTFPGNEKAPVFTETFAAGSIEISNQIIFDLLEFVEVAECQGHPFGGAD